MSAVGTTALDIRALDAHQHLDVSECSVNSPAALEFLRDDAVHRLAMMDEGAIDHALLMPSYDYDKRFGIESTRRAIEGLVQYRSWHADRFPWLGLTVEPQHRDAAVTLLDELLGTGEFTIASWHNRYQGASVDAEVMFDFVEVAAAHGVAIGLHATANLDHEEAWRVARLVRAFPGVRFVVFDALMTNPSIQILLDVMRGADNMWLDTAGAIAFLSLIRHLGREVGWDHVLFGSDYYGRGRGGDVALMRHQLQLCEIPDDAITRVFRTNLIDVFGAPEVRQR